MMTFRFPCIGLLMPEQQGRMTQTWQQTFWFSSWPSPNRSSRPQIALAISRVAGLRIQRQRGSPTPSGNQRRRWLGLTVPEEFGGMGLTAYRGWGFEISTGANHALQMATGLLPGAVSTLLRFGTADQKHRWIRGWPKAGH